jgi:hypothetical protein
MLPGLDVRLIGPGVLSTHTADELPDLLAVVALMAVMSATLLTWAKRQGWW